MKNSRDIYKVELHQPYKGKRDYYFSRMIGIYGVLSASLVGISYKSLRNKKLQETRMYANQFCVITLETLN